MSNRPDAPGKMIPSHSGVGSSTRAAFLARDETPRCRASFRHPSRTVRRQIPVQLGTWAHDGGTLSHLDLKQRPCSSWSRRGKTTSGEHGHEEDHARAETGVAHRLGCAWPCLVPSLPLGEARTGKRTADEIT